MHYLILDSKNSIREKMKKDKRMVFECVACGYQTNKWLGKCPSCNDWNTFLEISKEFSKVKSMSKENPPLSIAQIKEEEYIKISSNEVELDIVLGGGIVPGGLYLIGGSPGVGKSTLLLKVAGNIAKSLKDLKIDNCLESKITNKTKTDAGPKKVLYVSGEESLAQIKNRAKRCDCIIDNLYLLSEINLSNIKENLMSCEYSLCVIDSIQTIYSENLSAAPGSISQVREITFELMRIAKDKNIAIFIIGHITKDGQIAGPRVLEHMVDCVLYFEGEVSSELKILRGFKNRFGSTSEIGIFEMKENGLISATQATKKFFINKKDMPGSAALAIMEGSRCIVVEVQSLVSPIEFGIPKRLANGFDTNRLNMILALLDKKLGIELSRFDVFVNVSGGIKISEPSADLALIASILSSFKNRALKSSTAFLGEVSLIGDIREISGLESRLKELENFGFKNAIVPNIPLNLKSKIKCIEVKEVSKIIEWM